MTAQAHLSLVVPTTVGKWCLGHGVEGHAESLRTGHYVEGTLVAANFAPFHAGTKSLGSSLQPRCNHCRSIRRWNHHHENAKRRAAQWRRQHAKRWAKTGRSTSVSAALTEMDVGGVSASALVELILAAIDEPCPGLCGYEDDGEIRFHTISRVADLHIDVKDPTHPFALENLGVLCHSCNTAKGDEAWASFIFRRRAALRAWRDAIANPFYRWGEQLTLEVGS